MLHRQLLYNVPSLISGNNSAANLIKSMTRSSSHLLYKLIRKLGHFNDRSEPTKECLFRFNQAHVGTYPTGLFIFSGLSATLYLLL